MTRKSHNNSPISLFAFQDIITSVTGVFLLMTLLMAVELASREAMQQPVVSAEEIDRLAVSIEELEAEVIQLRENLASRTDYNLNVSEFTQSSADTAVQAIREELRLLNEQIELLKQDLTSLARQQSRSNSASRRREPDQKRLRDLQEMRVALEKEFARLKGSRRVFYNTIDARGRKVLLVELFDDAILVAEAGKKTPPRRFSGTRLRSGLLNPFGDPAFLDWARQQSKSEVRFVIIVHPGTTQRFKELSDELRQQGFSIGYDLLPGEKIAIDVQNGAG